MTSDKHDQTPAAPQPMPKRPTLADVQKYLLDADCERESAAEDPAEDPVEDPLAAGWRHMEESRGWK